MKTYTTQLTTLLLVLLTSCMSEPMQENIIPESSTGKSPVKMRSMSKTSAAVDTVALKSKIQSDYDLVLMNHIVRSDKGQYVLCLTKEDASEIGIPSELYECYSSFVESLNPENQ